MSDKIITGAGHDAEDAETSRQESQQTSDGRHATQPSPENVVISCLMSASEIASHLGDHGCENITNCLDISTCSTYPVSNGGFGDVYYGRLNDGTAVAIKTMRFQINSSEAGKKPLKDAARELHTWSKCQHPNVVGLLGLVEFQGRIGMVSRWMDNGSLPSYLVQHHDADRCQMSIQISKGLAYLHRSNIIHGDLKGANVLISSSGAPMITDFGNAILQERTLQFTHTTAKTNISPRWTAPELMNGSSTYSFAADVYALGMTILETITGKVPYHGKIEHALYHLIVLQKGHPERPEDEVPLNSRHGNALWSILTRCWAFEADARPSAVHVLGIMKTISREGLRPILVEAPKAPTQASRPTDPLPPASKQSAWPLAPSNPKLLQPVLYPTNTGLRPTSKTKSYSSVAAASVLSLAPVIPVAPATPLGTVITPDANRPGAEWTRVAQGKRLKFAKSVPSLQILRRSKATSITPSPGPNAANEKKRLSSAATTTLPSPSWETEEWYDSLVKFAREMRAKNSDAWKKILRCDPKDTSKMKWAEFDNALKALGFKVNARGSSDLEYTPTLFGDNAQPISYHRPHPGQEFSLGDLKAKSNSFRQRYPGPVAALHQAWGLIDTRL